jgi:hypothetical protein
MRNQRRLSRVFHLAAQTTYACCITALFRILQKRAFFGVKMPPQAVCFISGSLRRNRPSQTTLNIFCMRHRLKMRRVHAMPYSAQVVKFKPFRNLSYKLLIDKPMRLLTLPIVQFNLSISMRNQAARPQPATIRLFVYFRAHWLFN